MEHLADAMFEHIAEESRILTRLRSNLPADASIEQKQKMRDEASRLADDATRRRLGRVAAERVLSELRAPVAKIRRASANGRSGRDVLAPRRRRSRKG